MKPLPFRGPGAAVDRATPVKGCVPHRHIVAMPVGDVSVPICEHRVIGRVAAQVHHLFVVFQPPGFGALPALDQAVHRPVVGSYAEPGVFVLPAQDGSVVGGVSLEHPASDALFRQITDLHLFGVDWPLSAFITIEDLSIAPQDPLPVHIGYVGIAGGMHPSAVFVEALIGEKLSPGDGSVCMQAFFTHHLHFRSEVEGRVWVDVQHRPARGRQRRGDRESVGAQGFLDRLLFQEVDRRYGLSGMEGLDILRAKVARADGTDAAVCP